MCTVESRNADSVSSCNTAGKKAPLPSLGEIRAVIPKHCFERSLIKSLFFTARSVVLAGVVGYAAFKYIPMEFSLMNCLLWLAYAVVQGTILTGIWVEAHEAGHYAYSTSPLANDIMGFFLHSSLLVPYFSWQKTHATHHARCNHLLDGETHNPDLKRKVEKSYKSILEVLPEDAFALLQIVMHLVFGWIFYLANHTTGSRRSPVTGKRYTKKPNHFDPRACNELFHQKMRFKVFLSSMGCLAMLALLTNTSLHYGFGTVGLMYWGPYLVVNGWLVLYTWLQHCHPDVPFYGADTWNWLEGALSTVDRPYPWIVDELHHHIGTTHVAHHVFHELPHYHAVEATEALKDFLGEHYRYDSKSITAALWETATKCHYVESLEGVQYFQSAIDEYRAEKKNKAL